MDPVNHRDLFRGVTMRRSVIRGLSILLLVSLLLAEQDVPPISAASYVANARTEQARRAVVNGGIASNPLAGSTAANAAAATPSRYSITDVGPGGFVFAPEGLNSAEQVVGYGVTAGFKVHAYLWENGTVTDLHPNNASDSYATDINDSAQVVGFFTPNAGGYLRGFLWRDGTLQVLDTGGAFQPYAINNNGLIAGRAELSGRGVAVLWQNGVLRPLFPGSATESRAEDVNDSGQVVGWIRQGDQDRAFLWQTDENGVSQTTMLGTLGGKNSYPSAVDEVGVVVGRSQLANGVYHAFIWLGGTMYDLGTQEANYSAAYDINAALQIVGYDSQFVGGSFVDRAVLWQGRQMWHLNSLIPTGSGWDLRRAFYINDVGQIVGEGRRNGESRIFLLTPLAGIDDLSAEPGSLPGDVKLYWTAPDGEGSAAAVEYDIRYSRDPIDETTWEAAIRDQHDLPPGSPGEEEAHHIGELDTGVRWYFAVKFRRRDGTWSPLSNVPSLLDGGFRSKPNGYSFPNFGDVQDNDLTYDDMIRMFNSRAAVCYNDSGACQPKETAALWRLNALIKTAGGHCFGFSVTSLRFFEGIDNPAAFQPGALKTYDLAKANARANITFYQVRQSTAPYQGYRLTQQTKPPSAHLIELRDSLTAGTPGTVTLGFGWIRQGGWIGHSVVPYAVEERQDDWRIWAYDNMYPDLSATLVITPSVESWLYTFPDGFSVSGDASTHSLVVADISEIAKPSVCPYCPPPAAPNALAASSAASETTAAGEAQVWLSDVGHLLIRDSQGRRIGHVGDNLVNEIPGASFNLIPGGLDIPTEPIYTLPLTGTYEIELHGAGIGGVKPASLVQFGPGYAAGAQAIPVSGSTLDRVVIAGDGRRVTYRANAAKQVDLLLAADESRSRGYRLELQGVDLAVGAAVAAEMDAAAGRLVYRHHGAGAGEYAVSVRRSDAAGQRRFFHGGVAVAAGDVHRLDVAGWDGNGALRLEIDRGGDGTVDATVMLENRLVGVFLPLVLRR